MIVLALLLFAAFTVAFYFFPYKGIMSPNKKKSYSYLLATAFVFFIFLDLLLFYALFILSTLTSLARRETSKMERLSLVYLRIICITMLPAFSLYITSTMQQRAYDNNDNIEDTWAGHRAFTPALKANDPRGAVPIGQLRSGQTQWFYVPPAHPFLKTYGLVQKEHHNKGQTFYNPVASSFLVYPLIGGLVSVKDKGCGETWIDASTYCTLPAGEHQLYITHYLKRHRVSMRPDVQNPVVRVKIPTFTVSE